MSLECDSSAEGHVSGTVEDFPNSTSPSPILVNKAGGPAESSVENVKSKIVIFTRVLENMVVYPAASFLRNLNHSRAQDGCDFKVLIGDEGEALSAE
jgi:hypothetical protein